MTYCALIITSLNGVYIHHLPCHLKSCVIASNCCSLSNLLPYFSTAILPASTMIDKQISHSVQKMQMHTMDKIFPIHSNCDICKMKFSFFQLVFVPSCLLYIYIYFLLF